ncbi:MAG TPA: PAS domain-containing protein, partial [Chitinophagaceae bacterium]|nr:PAS domain-containing protein [Chitinophagaceae bacterium]
TGECFFSASYKKLYGFEEDELENRIEEWEKRTHPDDKKLIETAFKAHFSSDNPVYESIYRLKSKSKGYRWILARGMLLTRDAEGRPLRMIGTHTDITEQKNIEENHKQLFQKLQHSEEHYRLLFQSNPLPCWIYDMNSHLILEVNDAAVKHYGFSRKEFLKMKVDELHIEKERERIKASIDILNYKESFTISNWSHRKKNGEVIFVEMKGNSLKYNDKASRLVVVHDITETVEAKEALQKSNERFKLATKASFNAIYDWDLKSGEVQWGEGMQTQFGYQPNEIAYQWKNFIHQEDREKVSSSLTGTIYKTNKNYWKNEYRFKKADDTYSYVLDRGYIVRDENEDPVRMIGAMLDITEQKQNEQQIIESNERFDRVMKATHDLIWDWNLETGVFYRDKEGMRKVYGVENEKKIENVYSWLQRIHPEDHSHVEVVINSILQATDQNTFDVEYRFLRDDGSYSFVYDRGILIRNSEGKPVRLIGAAQDITERKLLQQQLLQREVDKQRLIGQATIETQEHERSEIGKELHDNVNQVLTTTKLYLDLSLSNPELKDVLIQKSTKNIIYVINEIRQLSLSLMNPSLGDLGLIDSINDLIENINATRKLHVMFDADNDLENLLSENQKLMVFRIIQEALNNSVKHAKATTFLLTLAKNNERAIVTMQDNGNGFEPAKVRKGSGLKNIQNRVYLSNGTVSLESAPGKGCKIIINFPIHITNTPIDYGKDHHPDSR